MKKTIKFIILPTMFLLLLAPLVLAQEIDFQLNQNNPDGLPLNQNDPYGLPLNQRNSSKTFQDEINTDTNQTQTSDQVGGVSINASQVPSIIRKVATYLYNAVLILSVIFILISAFYFLRGGDNPAYVKKAKSQLVYAVIGVAIAILAFSVEKIITSFIKVGQGG